MRRGVRAASRLIRVICVPDKTIRGCVKTQKASCERQFYSVKFDVLAINQINFTKLSYFTKLLPLAFCTLHLITQPLNWNADDKDDADENVVEYPVPLVLFTKR